MNLNTPPLDIPTIPPTKYEIKTALEPFIRKIGPQEKIPTDWTRGYNMQTSTKKLGQLEGYHSFKCGAEDFYKAYSPTSTRSPRR